MSRSINAAASPKVVDVEAHQRWESAGTDGSIGQLAGTRQFDVAAAVTATYELVCEPGASSSATIDRPQLTAIFTPAPSAGGDIRRRTRLR